MSDFKTAVIDLVRQIPRGRVASYGQIAAAVGRPRAAREVGWVLRGTGGGPDANLPWWRVINREGRISIKGNFESTPDLQRQLLEAEGIEVSTDLIVDMEKYQFHFKAGGSSPKIAGAGAAVLFIVGLAFFAHYTQAHGPVTTDSKTVNGMLVEFERNTLTNVIAGEPMQYIVRLQKTLIEPINYDSAFIRIRDNQQQTIAAGELTMDPTDPGSAKMNAIMPEQGQYTAQVAFHKAGQELASAEFSFQVFSATPKADSTNFFKKYLAIITFLVGSIGGAGFAWAWGKSGKK